MSRKKKYKLICKFTYNGEPYTKSNQLTFYGYGKGAGYPTYVMNYENGLTNKAIEVCKKKNLQPTTKPVRLKIDYYLKSRKIKDLGNLPKTTCDSLNGNVYEDDYYIVEMNIRKFYDPDKPRVEIQVDEILTDVPYTEIYPIGDENRSAPKKCTKRKKTSKRSKPKTKAVDSTKSTSLLNR